MPVWSLLVTGEICHVLTPNPSTHIHTATHPNHTDTVYNLTLESTLKKSLSLTVVNKMYNNKKGRRGSMFLLYFVLFRERVLVE